MSSDFVHLHLHSQYSLLDGANRLDDVLGAAVAAGMPAIALTDHGNLFGALEFYDRAKRPASSRSSASRPTSAPTCTTARRGGAAAAPTTWCSWPGTRPATAT